MTQAQAGSEVTDAGLPAGLGCGDACPVLSGRRCYDWDLPDLKGLDIESARAVREALAQGITRLADAMR